MKSIHIALICSLFICACHRHTISQSDHSVNHEYKDTHGNAMLLGKATKERLQQAPFGDWFNKNYDNYKIDSATADKLKPLVHDKHFLLFMGTWCGDSQREIPRIFKLLKYLGIRSSQIELVTVNNNDSAYKQSPTHEERGLNIHRVPDLIIYHDQNEMGRVVESPINSWEKDMLSILQGEAYSPNYKAVPWLVKMFASNTLEDAAKNKEHIAEALKPITEGRAELTSYGYVLMAAQDTAKALLVFQLNSLLFLTEPGVWITLGNFYRRSGDKSNALENYKKALTLQPDNEDIKKSILNL